MTFFFNGDASRLAWIDYKRKTIIEYNFVTNKWDSAKCDFSNNDIVLNGYFGKYLSIAIGSNQIGTGDNKCLIELKALRKSGKEKIAYLDSVYKDYNDKRPIPGKAKKK